MNREEIRRGLKELSIKTEAYVGKIFATHLCDKDIDEILKYLDGKGVVIDIGWHQEKHRDGLCEVTNSGRKYERLIEDA